MIALVQAATQVDVIGSSTSAPSITINGTTPGHVLVAVGAIFDNNQTWTMDSATDGANSFVLRQGRAVGTTSHNRGGVAVAPIVTGGDRTVAFNLSGVTGGANRVYTLGCWEFSGVKLASPEDVFDVNEEIDLWNGGSPVDISAGPITTTEAGVLIVGCALISGDDPTVNWASPASWTNTYRQGAGDANVATDAGYWLPGAIQTNYTAQWAHDNNVNDNGAGIIVALKSAVEAAHTLMGQACL